jgi:hypothetical protein
MPGTAILHEVQKLYGVSDRLDWLVGNIPSSQKRLGNPVEGERDSVLKANSIPVGR